MLPVLHHKKERLKEQQQHAMDLEAEEEKDFHDRINKGQSAPRSSLLKEERKTQQNPSNKLLEKGGSDMFFDSRRETSPYFQDLKFNAGEGHNADRLVRANKWPVKMLTLVHPFDLND